jgi:hypothetical protein
MQARRKRRAHPARTKFARLNALAFGLERGGRAALLAGASTIAFAAFGSAAAWSACSNGNQTISSATTGPVLGTWDGSTPGVGNITVDSGVSLTGGPQGVYAENCGIDTLENIGSISGQNGAGGVAVQANAGVTIKSLTNATGATVNGGSGQSAPFPGFGFVPGAGGAGVSNAGTISSLTNGGMAMGGTGGAGALQGGAGGAGIANSGTISSLTNSGTAQGGAGGATFFLGVGGGGGVGTVNSDTISSFTNSGIVQGGAGNAGGAGLANYDTITSLTNSGAIAGGAGDFLVNPGEGLVNQTTGTIGVLDNQATGTIDVIDNKGAIGGASMAGLTNFGKIGTLTNSGKLMGRAGGEGLVNETTGIVGVLDNQPTGTIDVIDNKGTIGGGAASKTGLLNVGKIGTLTNSGMLNGGAGQNLANTGGAGGAAVVNSGMITTTLTNSNLVQGGAGGAGQTHGGLGSAGVANSNAISALANSGMVSGGAGGQGSGGAGVGGAGGAGTLNSSTISTLTNSGTVQGGAAGYAAGGNAGVLGDTAGTGIANSSKISTLTNNGTVKGGVGGGASGDGGAGGIGMFNSGAITNVNNTKTVQGGAGGAANTANGVGGDGGTAISNSGNISSLTNSGKISGGTGGGGFGMGTGGAGIANSGTITSLTNSGTITVGAGPAALGTASQERNAIYSEGSQGGVPASIGSITNSGHIIGNVGIYGQANLDVYGGNGTTFGSWSGGTITIGAGNLTFAMGNTALADNIDVYDGSDTVFNDDQLQISSPLTITGNFAQSSSGVLELDFAGSAAGQYGALTVTSLATLDGSVAIDLTDGFTLTTGENFDILTYQGALSGEFDAVSLDGMACSAAPMNEWMCSGGVIVSLNDPDGTLGLYVVHGSPSVVPEPSTWTMLLSGFLGLGALALRRRTARAGGARGAVGEG